MTKSHENMTTIVNFFQGFLNKCSFSQSYGISVCLRELLLLTLRSIYGSTSWRRKDIENISWREHAGEQGTWVSCKSPCCAGMRAWAQSVGSMSGKQAGHADTLVITARGGRNRRIPGVHWSTSIVKWTSSRSLNDPCQNGVDSVPEKLQTRLNFHLWLLHMLVLLHTCEHTLK